MEDGADISTTNSSGLNAFFKFSIIRKFSPLLIEKYGFDINSKDNKGNSALHWVV